jgi:prolyl-tRNA editing enzyme YbaK/EbsC (Cys-tRNA(Pro) deacylase)
VSGDPSILDPRVRASLDSLGVDYETLPCAEHLADTAAFCAEYGIPPEEACNTIVVALKTDPRTNVVCLVLATTKIDANHRLSALVGIRRLSFASADEIAQLTGMMIGGVTPFGLPEELPVYIDSAVMKQERVVIGGGNRTSKVRLDPAGLTRLPNARVEEIAVPR